MSVTAIAFAITINLKYNAYKYITDSELHGKADYWQTPTEFHRNKKGDCEDYAIAKYKALWLNGVTEDNIRLAYVVAKKNNQAHMVLLYRINGDWMVLDNMIDAINALHERTDLMPVYSFNTTRLWEYTETGKELERFGSENVGPVRRLNEIMKNDGK